MLVPVVPMEKPLAGPDGKTPPLVFPEDSNCFLLGSNGVFQQVANEFYTIRLKKDPPSFLAEIDEYAKLHTRAYPIDQLRIVETFFAKVYETKKSEAVVLLYYSPTKREWKTFVPLQVVNGMKVTYETVSPGAEFEGYTVFGTIHSHCSIGAFHSGTDDKDEHKFDGLHVTIGHVDQVARSYACRWILSGKVFPCQLGDCIAGAPKPDFPEAWLDNVKSPEPTVDNRWLAGYGGGAVQVYSEVARGYQYGYSECTRASVPVPVPVQALSKGSNVVRDPSDADAFDIDPFNFLGTQLTAAEHKEQARWAKRVGTFDSYLTESRTIKSLGLQPDRETACESKAPLLDAPTKVSPPVNGSAVDGNGATFPVSDSYLE